MLNLFVMLVGAIVVSNLVTCALTYVVLLNGPVLKLFTKKYMTVAQKVAMEILNEQFPDDPKEEL